MLCCLCMQTALFAQEISLKYGKINNSELTMSTYSNDTSAVAVILYEDGYCSYDVVNSNFQLGFEFSKKIKILKQEGVDIATISIPYYTRSAESREQITNLEAIAYNLENGKVVKSKLEKKYIFDEELGNRYRQIKFSIPNVKKGTVIEYKYKKSSNLLYNIDDWNIQGKIPVINSRYEVRIPEYFYFNVDTKGYESIKVDEKPGNMQFHLGQNSNGPIIVSCSSRELVFTAKDVPAMKDEVYVWCVNDFLSGVRFELKGTKFPNDFYKPYSQTWEDLEKYIKDESDFGTNMKMQNPYKDEIKALVEKATDEKEKIELIYSFIKSQIRWDETYSFYGNRAREAVKNGKGDNGQINMILLSALRDAGIKAYPILLNRRSSGRIPYTFPSFNKLNTFIVAAQTSDNKTYYMDGSAVHGGLNMLPVNLLVDRARVFDPNIPEKWIDLTSISRNQQVSIIQAKLEPTGALNGEVNTVYTNQLAYMYKSTFANEKDSTDYVEKFQSSNQMVIDSIKVTGKEPMSSRIVEIIKFKKNSNAEGQFIYINPLIFLHMKENRFTQSERKLPIEFSYPYTYVTNCTLIIPDNYKVEELPKSLKIMLNEKAGLCTYQITQIENKIQIAYRFDLNQIVFPQTEYAAISDFFGQTVNKNLEMIVLKKI